MIAIGRWSELRQVRGIQVVSREKWGLTIERSGDERTCHWLANRWGCLG